VKEDEGKKGTLSVTTALHGASLERLEIVALADEAVNHLLDGVAGDAGSTDAAPLSGLAPSRCKASLPCFS